MAEIQDSDGFIISRGGVLYRKPAELAKDAMLDTDTVIVERNKALFQCRKDQLDDKLLDTDHMITERGGVLYRVDGERLRDYFADNGPFTGIITNPGYNHPASCPVFSNTQIETQTLTVASSSDLPWGPGESLYMIDPLAADPSQRAYYTPVTAPIKEVTGAVGDSFRVKTVNRPASGAAKHIGSAFLNSSYGEWRNCPYGQKISTVVPYMNSEWYGIDLGQKGYLRIKWDVGAGSGSRFLTKAWSDDGVTYRVDNENEYSHEAKAAQQPTTSFRAARYWACYNAASASSCRQQISQFNSGNYNQNPVYFFTVKNWNVFTEPLSKYIFELPNKDLKYFQTGERVSNGGLVHQVNVAENWMTVEGGTRLRVGDTITGQRKSGSGKNSIPPSSTNNRPEIAKSNGEWIDNDNRLGKEFAISSHQWV